MRSREMRSWYILFGASVAVAVVMLAGAAVALASAPVSGPDAAKAFAHCERATSRWERISSVPSGLLRAISMAESGRWSNRDKIVRAWPWTVTSGGPGTFFPTKQAALAEVRRLQSKGVTNIDVGCMQVNLHFHGEHFASIEDAMDPDINAAYAARFLTQLREGADSWNEAAGHYHSRTPERTAYYRSKVEKFWDQLGNPQQVNTEIASVPSEAIVIPTTPTHVTITPIDRSRTAALNARFKTLKTAARKLREDLDPEAKRERQLAAWKNARGRVSSLQYLLAKRKAELEKRRKLQLEKAFTSTRDERFKENRLNQIAAWRKRITTAEPSQNN